MAAQTQTVTRPSPLAEALTAAIVEPDASTEAWTIEVYGRIGPTLVRLGPALVTPTAAALGRGARLVAIGSLPGATEYQVTATPAGAGTTSANPIGTLRVGDILWAATAGSYVATAVSSTGFSITKLPLDGDPAGGAIVASGAGFSLLGRNNLGAAPGWPVVIAKTRITLHGITPVVTALAAGETGSRASIRDDTPKAAASGVLSASVAVGGATVSAVSNDAADTTSTAILIVYR